MDFSALGENEDAGASGGGGGSVMRAALGQQKGMTMVQATPNKSTVGPGGTGLRGFPIPKQIERLISRGVQKTLQAEYFFIYDNQMTFDHFLHPDNSEKNRYQNMILWDETRVILQDDWSAKHGNYIHASHVDGYNRLSEYILTQAPFNDYTERLFWRMVQQEKPILVVLLTPINDNQGNKQCSKFWPNKNQELVYFYGRLKVKCTDVKKIGNGIEDISIDVTFIPRDPDQKVTNVATQNIPLPKTKPEVTSVHIMWYDQWVTDTSKVPDSLLHFRNLSNTNRDAALKEAGTGRPISPESKSAITWPIIVMCPTGVHRAGTYCAMDIILERYTHSNKADIDNTIKQLRQERWGCVQQLHHYLYLAETLLNADKTKVEGQQQCEIIKEEREKALKDTSAQPLANQPRGEGISAYTVKAEFQDGAPLAARPAAAQRQARV